MKRNKIRKGFLKKHRTGKDNSTVYLPLNSGFLKLEYGLYETSNLLSLVSFVLDDLDDAMAIGMRLEMNLTPDGNAETVTWISENGVSGIQWSDGQAFWGHTYDDDSVPQGRKISLADWIDECLDKMTNPVEGCE